MAENTQNINPAEQVRDSSDARWYVIHTYAGYENKVARDLNKIVENRNLQDQILDIKIPTKKVTETVVVVKDGVETVEEKQEEEQLLFPGYVLVKMVMSNENWFIVRNTRGCTGFVGHDSKLVPDSVPVPLSDAEAEKWGVEFKAVKLPFEIGEEVKVIRGNLKGITGKVDAINIEAKTVSVQYELFGKQQKNDFDISDVVPLN